MRPRGIDVIRPGVICALALLWFGPSCAQSDSVMKRESDAGKFVFTEFQHPDAFFSPGYMWTWNDRLVNEDVAAQLRDMADHGAMMVNPVPEPTDFRPTTQPTRLAPDYLTPEYLDIFRSMVDEAARLGMKVWLYDEGGWPSGTVCWRLPRQYPQYQRQDLQRQELEPKRGEVVEVPSDCVAAFLYQGAAKLKRLPPGAAVRRLREETVAADGARVLIFSIARQSSLTDLLNPSAVRRFIEMTHEKYRQGVGDRFAGGAPLAGGAPPRGVVPLIFTDEPRLGAVPWTDDLARDFAAAKGCDLIDKLPSLYEGDAPQDMQVRVDFYDWWSRRWADSYFGQIQEWCHRHGFYSGGHLDNDDATTRSVRMNGSPLRMYRKLDVPGVDVIWRQIFPGQPNHYYPKFAASVAHQAKLPWALTESFGVYGDGVTPEQMKWVADFQYVRGLNLMDMIGVQLSTRDWLIAHERPIFGPGNPLWRYLPQFHSYLARLGYVLTRGRAGVTTAIYYPVRDIWAHIKGGDDWNAPTDVTASAALDALAEKLLASQCDFDFVDDDLLESARTKVAAGKLRVGAMEYDTVCVPSAEWMTAKAKAKLARFAVAGGKVLWLDARPQSIPPKGAVVVAPDEIAHRIAPLVRVEPANERVRVCKRILPNGSLYFITNEDTSDLSCTVRFRESAPIAMLDAESGKCYQPAGARRLRGGWRLPLDLPFAGSCILIFTADKLPLAPAPPKAGAALLTLGKGWRCRRATAYIVGEHDREVHDLAGETPTEVSLGDWRGIVGEGFSGDVEYGLTFECSDEAAAQAAVLDLGEVRYACAVTLNGENLGTRAWRPFSFASKGKLKPGTNELKVTVTNTLANQYVTTHALDGWSANQLGPYHQRALRFEADSLPSGLYGPVTIRAGL